MKSIRKVLAGSFAVGALLAAATSFSVASAQDGSTAATTEPSGPHGHGGHHHGGPWHIYGKLGLTPEQKASIKAIFAAAKP